MPRLQELLSQSVVQNLGLGDILEQREREAKQLGLAKTFEGDVAAAKVRSSDIRQRGFFETMGTIIGGTAGFVLGGPTGGLAGAAQGAKLGQAGGGFISGKAPSEKASATSNLIQQGIGLKQQFDTAAVSQAKTEAETALLRKKAGAGAGADRDGIVSTIKGRKVLLDKRTGEVIKDLGIDISGDKVVKANQGLHSVRQIKTLMDPSLKKKGWTLTTDIWRSKTGVFKNERSRAIFGSFKNAIDIIMRDRTGAVINKDEMSDAMASWGLQIGDSAAVVQKKINDLETMLNLAGGDIDPGTKEGKKALSLQNEMVNSMSPFILKKEPKPQPKKSSVLSKQEIDSIKIHIENNPDDPESIKAKEQLKAMGVSF